MPKYIYSKRRLLGHGGGGRVYEGKARFSLGEYERPCAIKVMHESQADDAESVARFAQEARIGHELMGHANLVGTLSFGRATSGQPYLIMSREGPTLQVLDEVVQWPLPVVWRIAEGVISGLLALQEHGWQHGDLNPGNIFLGLDGRVKVGDFGRASTHGDDRRRVARLIAELATSEWLAPGEDLQALIEQVPGELQPLLAGLAAQQLSLEAANALVQQHRSRFASIDTMKELAQLGMEERAMMAGEWGLADSHMELEEEEFLRVEHRRRGAKAVDPLASEDALIHTFDNLLAKRDAMTTPSRRSMKRLRWYAAASSLVAVASLVLLLWPERESAPQSSPSSSPSVDSTTPAPASATQTFSINRLARFGELTMILSHAEEDDERTQLHVYVVNPSDQPQPAELTIDEDETESHEDQAEPVNPRERPASSVVPPRSTVHRVLEVRKRGDRPVKVKARGLKRRGLLFEVDQR